MGTFTRRTRSFFQGARGTQYEKFSMWNHPTEKIFKWLFQSVGFIYEKDDTASTDEQGFVKISGDAAVVLRDSTKDLDGYTKIVLAHQLAIVAGDNENINGSGDVNNRLDVTAYNTTTGRTGGTGITFIVKNTMKGTVDIGLTFIGITQVNSGNDFKLTFDSSAFNTEIVNSSAYNTLLNTVSNIENKIVTGKLGEIKMYGFVETLGATNCEFDANGIGRADGTDGATGIWEGWVILGGQTIASINALGADTTITARLSKSGNLPNTKQSYPVGIDTGSSSYDVGYDGVGANSVALDVAETPVKSHYHGTSSITTNSVNTGTQSINHAHDTTYNYYPAAPGSYSAPLALNNSEEPTHNLPSEDNNANHFHVVPSTGVTGNTDSTTNATATAHENRPLSFVVCYAIYVGTDGSLV